MEAAALALTTAHGLFPLTLGDAVTVGTALAGIALEDAVVVSVVDGLGAAATVWTANQAHIEKENLMFAKRLIR